MNCAECQERLPLVFDGETEARAMRLVIEHAQSCASCGALHAELITRRALLRSLGQPRIPSALRASVASAVKNEVVRGGAALHSYDCDVVQARLGVLVDGEMTMTRDQDFSAHMAACASCAAALASYRAQRESLLALGKPPVPVHIARALRGQVMARLPISPAAVARRGRLARILTISQSAAAVLVLSLCAGLAYKAFLRPKDRASVQAPKPSSAVTAIPDLSIHRDAEHERRDADPVQRREGVQPASTSRDRFVDLTPGLSLAHPGSAGFGLLDLKKPLEDLENVLDNITQLHPARAESADDAPQAPAQDFYLPPIEHEHPSDADGQARITRF